MVNKKHGLAVFFYGKNTNPVKEKMMKLAFSKLFLLLLLYGATAFMVVSFITGPEKTGDGPFHSLRLIILILFLPVLFKYAVHLFISPWYELIEKFTQKRDSRYLPRVSVIIPAWNEEVGIISTLQSIIGSVYTNIEIIVVDDGSTDTTQAKVNDFLTFYEKEGQAGIPITYERIKNSGKAQALNRGVFLSRGDIIITIDADSVMDAHAIESFVTHFQNPRVMSVAGNVKIGNKAKCIGIMQQLEYMYGFYFKKADSLLNSVYIVGGAAAAYRRSIFNELGGFDPTIITEDIEFSMRIQNAGHTITYQPRALVYTEGPSDIAGLCHQRLRWKYGRLLTFYKYRRLFFSFNKKHSKFLSFVVLPIHLFAEMLLFGEIALLAIFYGYTFYTHDFLPLILFIVLLALVVAFQIITDVKFRENSNLLVWIPVAWCLFYLIDLVEYQALVRSCLKLLKKDTLEWQKWHRSGVF